MNNFILNLKVFTHSLLTHIFLYNRKIINFPKSFLNNESRILEDLSNEKFSNEVILTTYFTSKKDPQRNLFTAKNDFNYIKDFYFSIINNNLNAIIFYDDLEEEFILEYTNQNIKFIKCSVLDYSLNDERFFIYEEFLKKVEVEKVLMSDVNDVTFGIKDLFKFIENKKIYLGRDENLLVGQSDWIKEKIKNLPQYLKNRLPKGFYDMPFLNAGVIGGDSKIMISFLEKVNYIFTLLDNNLNNNMAVINIVFYSIYWRKYSIKFNYKFKKLNRKKFQENSKNDNYKFENFYIGRPFTSRYKHYENNNDCYIYHK